MALINGTAGNNVLNGTLGDDVINGLGGHDQLFGDRGNDELNGGSGNDTLRGGVGSDQLNGGTGADHMNGGDGDDFYTVDNVGDVAQESFDDVDAGFDWVDSSVTYSLGFGIENLFLTGTAAINGTGNAKGNQIRGNDANNVLNGGGGDDILNGGGGNDLLNGGTGADHMDGNDGNDTYIVDDVNDDVSEFELTGSGIDIVKASVTHTLGNDIEDLILTSSAAINGTGNEENNVITGNSANNAISGLSGNDHLLGGNGNDVLTGGAGADALMGGVGTDTFKYKSVSDSRPGAGSDVITDFNGAGAAVGDKIDLTAIDANTLVSGNQAFTYIGSAAFTAAGQLRYAGGILSGSTDADTASEFQIHLLGGPGLVVGGTGTDILL